MEMTDTFGSFTRNVTLSLASFCQSRAVMYWFLFSTFLIQNGWLQSIAASGDQCACIATKSSSGFVAITHEFSATERLLNNQLSSIKSSVVKTLQSAGMQSNILPMAANQYAEFATHSATIRKDEKGYYPTYTEWPKKTRTVDFSGLCSDQ